jgi:homoserine dehydrogenase
MRAAARQRPISRGSREQQLLSQHGEELWAVAREHERAAALRGAVAGVVPVIRVLQESLAAAHVERIHGIVNGTTELHPLRDGARRHLLRAALRQAQELGYAEADPTDDVTGRDAAAKMAILARLAFSTPVHLDQVAYEGIEHITADDMAYADELGLGLKLIGTGRARRRRHQRPRAPRLPLRRSTRWPTSTGPFNAGHRRVRRDHRDHDVRPRRRRPQTASAVLGDVVSAMIPPASTPETTEALPLVGDVVSRLLRAHGGRRPPGVLAQIAEILGMQGASIKSFVQRGLGDNARLVMVLHPLLESRLYAAVRMIAQLDFMRAAPRAIRVIDEDFS